MDCVRDSSACNSSARSSSGSGSGGGGGVDADRRCILHLDVDSFYCACEIRRRPELRDQPLAVTQFNSGGFVAVSEAARRCGIRKGDGIGAGGQEALDFYKDRPEALMPAVRRRCPELVVLPMDTTWYRQCSADLLKLISTAPCWTAATKPPVEKSSIDDFFVDCTQEVLHRSSPRAAVGLVKSPSPLGSDAECPTYLDAVSIYRPSSGTVQRPCTPHTSLHGPGDHSALVACTIAHELRNHVRQSTRGMTLSCGIATSKLLARLVSKRPGMPDAQTILFPADLNALLKHCPLRAVPGLKGALGRRIQERFGKQTPSTPHLQSHENSVEPHAERRYQQPNQAQLREQLCLGDLAQLSVTQLAEVVGSGGRSGQRAAQLVAWGRGFDTDPVETKGPSKSLLSERSYPSGALDSTARLRDAVLYVNFTEMFPDAVKPCRIYERISIADPCH